jgi:hypothetical protein
MASSGACWKTRLGSVGGADVLGISSGWPCTVTPLAKVYFGMRKVKGSETVRGS